ncbi:MAG TPA: DnaJ domain-containing protein, partial [Patescibacteria group bacterium]
MDASKKTEFLGQLTDMVLANLKPFGRSRLYTGSDEKSLSQNVNNVASMDHFQILGVGRSATDKEITEAYFKTSKRLEASKSAEAKQQLEEVKLAYRILSDKTSRAIYEAAGVDPTIEHKMIGPSIFYMHLTKFSPISLNEFQLAADEADKKGGEALDTLIFDLRGNIGGAIDSLPYFLG